ncbi:CCA tRNA nucleotidyltransferase [Rickettsia endosymbiont of Halotydeus destructor]|uniref:CCA tRNA nucleotidyltransferase n=1 Tax=Rickettsia endosymbiont of Halotydeus destructor TaxID=2996754 RepID=UPI003BB21259
MYIIKKFLQISSKGYKKILTELRREGGQARLIGGCVRDALLNKDSYDIDIATTLLPDEVIKVLSKADIKVIPTGIKFGTVTAILNKEKFEITTLRKDIDCNGRHAKVLFTDNFAVDAARRDFTINALSYCPFENKIYDYFKGLEDLKLKKLVFIGQASQRIKEDYLRILRFFRFSSYYADHLNDEGLEACKNLQEGLKILSRERIKSEMDKIIISKNSPTVLKVMFDTGILSLIFSVKYYEVKFFEQASFFNLQLSTRYALLLYKIEDLKLNVLINWKYSKQDATKIFSIITLINSPKITEFDMKKIWWENSAYKEYLFAATLIGKLEFSQIQIFIDKYDQLERSIFPLTGHDLLRINIENKEIGKQLEYVKNIWIENDFVQTKSQLLTFIEK